MVVGAAGAAGAAVWAKQSGAAERGGRWLGGWVRGWGAGRGGGGRFGGIGYDRLATADGDDFDLADHLSGNAA